MLLLARRASLPHGVINGRSQLVLLEDIFVIQCLAVPPRHLQTLVPQDALKFKGGAAISMKADGGSVPQEVRMQVEAQSPIQFPEHLLNAAASELSPTSVHP